MCEDPVQICAAQFERHVDALVSFYKRGNILVSSPLFADRAVPIEEIPKLKHLVRNALHARAWFERHGPAWAQPLPLSDFERFSAITHCSVSRRFIRSHCKHAISTASVIR